jgi:hypothetical protein
MDYLNGYSREYIDFEKSEPIFPIPKNKQAIIAMNQTYCLVDFFGSISYDSPFKQEAIETFKDRYELLDYNGLYDESRKGEYIWDTPQIQRLLLDVNNALEDIDKLLRYKSLPEKIDIEELEKCYYTAYDPEDPTWFNLPPVPGEPDQYYFGKEGLRQWLAGMKFLCEDCLKKDFVLFVSED